MSDPKNSAAPTSESAWIKANPHRRFRLTPGGTWTGSTYGDANLHAVNSDRSFGQPTHLGNPRHHGVWPNRRYRRSRPGCRKAMGRRSLPTAPCRCPAEERAMNALPQADRTRLVKLLTLLGSDHAGERDAAGLAAHRLLKQRGLSWEDALAPRPAERRLPEMGTWRTTCATLVQQPRGVLRPWERNFVEDLPKFSRISTKQRYILSEISRRVLGDRA